MIIRWVHIIAGTAWLGTVVAVVFVLVPSLHKLEGLEQNRFAQLVFPRVFRVASVLSVTVIAAGVLLYLEKVGWRFDLAPLVSTRWGWSILIGAVLGIALTGFHFFAEHRLLPIVKGADGIDAATLRLLRLAPRGGLGVLVTVVVLMSYAAHGG
jgi:uncharacterized membrane protein